MGEEEKPNSAGVSRSFESTNATIKDPLFLLLPPLLPPLLLQCRTPPPPPLPQPPLPSVYPFFLYFVLRSLCPLFLFLAKLSHDMPSKDNSRSSNIHLQLRSNQIFFPPPISFHALEGSACISQLRQLSRFFIAFAHRSYYEDQNLSIVCSKRRKRVDSLFCHSRKRRMAWLSVQEGKDRSREKDRNERWRGKSRLNSILASVTVNGRRLSSSSLNAIAEPLENRITAL